MPSAKDAARQIIEHLPDKATWDDIMYELYVKQKIEEGLADIESGRTIPHEEIKAELLGRGDWMVAPLSTNSDGNLTAMGYTCCP